MIITDKACREGQADIVVSLDTSDSIHRKQFHEQIIFVKHLFRHFNIGENAVRFGVLTFGTDITSYINLWDHFTKTELADAVEKIPYGGGRTSTETAIKHAREVMFSAKHDARGNVPKINIIITDGTSRSKVYDTALEASKSRAAGIHLVVVGVGMGPHVHDLRYLVDNKEKDKSLFIVKHFLELGSLEEVIVTAVCEGMYQMY